MTQRSPALTFVIAFFLSAIILFSLILAYRMYETYSEERRGSFEFVRRGEELLEKGRFEEAIRQLRKAAEYSPDNKAISSYLTAAYTSYAEKLYEAANLDGAIGQLTLANELSGNATTAQNLAVMYEKKALALMKSSDGSAARTAVESALSTASSSNNASRALARVLLSDGIGQFKEGREDSAIFLISSSCMAYDTADARETLGDLYYKRTELASACDQWGRALALDPARTAIGQKIEKAGRERAVAARQSSAAYSHFEVRFAKGARERVEDIAALLESARTDIGADLGYAPEGVTVVILYDPDDFRRVFDLKPCFEAFYDGNIRMPLPPSGANERALRRHIYHEYTHAILSAMTKSNTPVWLNEGIALYEEYRHDDAEIRAAVRIVAAGGVPALSSVAGVFKDAGADEISLRNAYVLSYTAVKFVIDTWGVGGLRRVLKRVSEGQHVANAIDDEFLVSEGEFDKRWSAYVAKEF